MSDDDCQIPNVSGLCGEGVSFQLRQYPDRFALCFNDDEHSLHAADFEDNNQAYRMAACFRPHRGRYQLGSDEPFISFENLRHRGYFLYYVNVGKTLETRLDDLSAEFK